MNTANRPFRKNNEAIAATFWFVTFIALLGSYISGDESVLIPLLFALSAFVIRVSQALQLTNFHHRLNDQTVSVITENELKEIKRKHSNELFYGSGFVWGKNERKLLEQSRSSECIGVNEGELMHGLHSEKRIFLPADNFGSHTLVVGTTGSGKTRFVELLLTQKILSEPKEAIVVLDPKGDKGLQQSLKHYAGERFMQLDILEAQHSVSINVLADYVISSEVATRISSLLPQEAGSMPFTSQVWQAINAIVKGYEFLGEKVTLKKLSASLSFELDTLCERVVWHAIEKYHPKELDKAKVRAGQKIGRARVLELFNVYKELSIMSQMDDSVMKLFDLYKLTPEYLNKMISGIFPILGRLTESPLGELLSPSESEVMKSFTLNQILSKGKVLYVNLNCLLDQEIGQAVGSLLLSSLVSIAGAVQGRQNSDFPKVNIFIDEASMLSTNAMINLLNKGRSCGFQVTIATQTFNDFRAALGNDAKAKEVLANTNMKVFLRTLDRDTQQFAVESMPMVEVERVSTSFSSHLESQSTEVNSRTNTILQTQMVSLIPPEVLGSLPNLHYILVLPHQTIKGRLAVINAS